MTFLAFSKSMPAQTCRERYVEFQGQPLFSKNRNCLTLNIHNFFVFCSNKKSLWVSVNQTQLNRPTRSFCHRPIYRPEISVSKKSSIFFWLGYLPPFIFSKNEKKIFYLFFFFRLYKSVFKIGTNFFEALFLFEKFCKKVNTVMPKVLFFTENNNFALLFTRKTFPGIFSFTRMTCFEVIVTLLQAIFKVIKEFCILKR